MPKGVESLKISFMGRMKSLFNKDKFINARDLSILLNDLFINEMDSHIISECENIIELVIEIYKESIKIKNEARSAEEGQEQKE